GRQPPAAQQRLQPVHPGEHRRLTGDHGPAAAAIRRANALSAALLRQHVLLHFPVRLRAPAAPFALETVILLPSAGLAGPARLDSQSRFLRGDRALPPGALESTRARTATAARA